MCSGGAASAQQAEALNVLKTALKTSLNVAICRAGVFLATAGDTAAASYAAQLPSSTDSAEWRLRP
jgi:hypothetical protein